MKKSRLINLYLIILAAIGAICAALRSYALLTTFNHKTMYFDNKIAITVSGVLVCLAIIVFMGYMIFAEKRENLITRSDNAASYIPAGIVSIALMFMAGERLVHRVKMYSPEFIELISIITGALAILSIVAFFLSIMIQKRGTLYKAAFSLCIVFFLAFYAAFLFFNKEAHPTNSPNKTVDQMAYLFASVFFLYESRIFLGRAKWRAYVAFGLSATLLCVYSAIPSLITYAVSGYVVSDTIIESILTLAIGLYIGSKLLQFKKLPTDTECQEAKSIASMAALRQEEIEEQRRLAHEHTNNIKEENEKTEDASNYTFDIPVIETTTEFNPDEEA